MVVESRTFLSSLGLRVRPNILTPVTFYWKSPGLCRDTCPYFGPQTWLNEARTNIGLSPTMFFFLMKMTVWLISNFGRTVVRSVFYYGLFKTLSFLSLSVGFLRGKRWGGEGQGRTYFQHPNVLVGLRRPQIRR